jgi:hypothetical protein
MAQPPLLPRGAFDPVLTPSPVQIAIRRARGLDLLRKDPGPVVLVQGRCFDRTDEFQQSSVVRRSQSVSWLAYSFQSAVLSFT